MKKTITAICLFYFLILTASAQHFSGAINLGVNALQVDGDEVFGYHKAGLNIGPSASWSFNDKISSSIEILFNQKGANQKARYYSNHNPDSGAYKLNLTYLEVPVLIHFNDKDRITAGAGLSWGRLVQVKEWEDGRLVNTTSIGNKTYSSNDWNVLAEIRFRVINRLWFNLRYAYSIAKIRTRTFPSGEVREQYNNLLTFRLVYLITNASD